MQNIARVATILAIVVAAGALTSLIGTTVTEAPPSYENALARSFADLERDTDGDGLKDWEEELVGTDPHTSDTDGDGVEDDQEFGGSGVISSLKKPPEAEVPTLTQQAAQNLFLEYLGSAPGAGGAEKEQIAQKITDLLTQTHPEERYTPSDMTPAPDTTEGRARYGEELVQVIQRHTILKSIDVITLFRDAAEAHDVAAIVDLEHEADTYEGLAATLVALPVPDYFLAQHTLLTNSYSMTAHALHRMSQLYIDSVGAIAGFAAYQQAGAETYDALAAILSLIRRL